MFSISCRRISGSKMRNGRDAQFDLLVAALDLDPAVLGPAFLGDIHPREHLDPGDEGRVDRFRDGVNVVENPIDPEPDEGLLALRLDVDVRGPLVEGVVEQVVNRVDDVLVVALDELLEVAQVDRRRGLALGGLDRGPEAEELAEDADDVRLGGQDPHDGHLPGRPQALDEVGIEGVGHRHRQRVPLLENGHDEVLQGEGTRHVPGHHIEVQPEGVDLPVLHPGRLGDGLGDDVLIEGLVDSAGEGEAE
jgi:hypothetical protein